MLDLSTTYLGLKLKNPLVASAGPYCKDIGNILRIEDAGMSAVVLHSLFEEQINLESSELDRYLSFNTEAYAESLSYFPDMGGYNIGRRATSSTSARPRRRSTSRSSAASTASPRAAGSSTPR